jgi:predicted permease
MRWWIWPGTRTPRRVRGNDIDRELQDHLELEAEAQGDAGLPPDAARRAARLLLGEPGRIKEDVRALSPLRLFEHLLQDLRYAARILRHAPAFTATAVLALGLGIGASTAMFTLVNAAMLRPLPVARPNDLVLVTMPDGVSYPVYRTLAGASQSVTHLVAASAANRATMDFGHGAFRGTVKVVSGNYFEGLGVPPAAGRVFRPAEETEPLAIVSHALWQSSLGGSPDAVGRLVRLNGTAFTVVGVAPRGFFGESSGESPDLWTTMALIPAQMRNERGFTWLRVVGRMKPGMRPQQVQTELALVAGPSEATTLSVSPGARGTAGLRERLTGPVTIASTMVGLVLLVACTNLASLLLTRGASRRPEIAVRLALGARRGRVIRQLMTENLLLASAGGILGLLLSVWGTRALVGLVAGTGETLALDLRPDGLVLLFATAVTVASTLLFGVAPAVRTARSGALVEHGPRVVGRSRRWELSDALIVAQIGLSLALLAGGTMFVRTVRNLQTQDLGSQPSQLVLAAIDADRGNRPDPSVLLPQLLERIRALPGVSSASVASFGTLANQGGIYGIEVDGFMPTGEQDQRARADYVGPDYLRTAGIPLVAGREFAWTDRPSSPRVAIVNETMARFYYGDATAVGRRFRFNKAEYEIVGVARDAKYNSLREAPPPRYVYFAQLQRMGPGVGNLEIRTTAGPVATLAAVRAIVAETDSRLAVSEVTTMTERISRKVGVERMLASLSVFFAGLTLLLAAVGIYGTFAYRIARRTRELGVRLALGSKRAAVVWLVARNVLVLLGAGLAAGFAVVVAGGRLVASLLFGLTPTDPLTFVVAGGVLVAVALIAAAIPATRAARLDPARVLRE